MNQLRIDEVIAKINDFESQSDEIHPIKAEEEMLDILTPLLESEGYSVEHTGGIDDGGIDYLGTKEISENNTQFTLGIQYKHHRKNRPASLSEVQNIIGVSQLKGLNRAILLVNTSFSNEAILATQKNFPTSIELLDLNQLKAWVSGIEVSGDGTEDDSIILATIVEFSKLMARCVAQNPKELENLEWRDLERMLTEVFKGLKFEATLTPGSKDGGKDIILTCSVSGENKSYIVEVKHWRSEQRVGSSYIKDFVEVVAKEQHDGGLFLATYGYAQNAFETLTEVERKMVKFEEESKVVSLCQMYVKAESGIWSPPTILPEIIFDEVG